MSHNQSIPNPVLWEKTTGTIRLQLTDSLDEELTLAELDTVLLTLYDVESGTILNSRNGVSIKNENGGTVDAGGGLALELSDADNALLSQSVGIEWHVALIVWTWAGGTKTGRKRVAFQVANEEKVT